MMTTNITTMVTIKILITKIFVFIKAGQWLMAGCQINWCNPYHFSLCIVQSPLSSVCPITLCVQHAYTLHVNASTHNVSTHQWIICALSIAASVQSHCVCMHSLHGIPINELFVERPSMNCLHPWSFLHSVGIRVSSEQWQWRANHDMESVRKLRDYLGTFPNMGGGSSQCQNLCYS